MCDMEHCCRLQDNKAMLRDRLQALEESRRQLEDTLKQQVAYSRTLDREMNTLKPEVIELMRQRERHQKWLLQHGMKQHRINLLLIQSQQPKASQDAEPDTESLPHQNDATWLLHRCTRQQAEQMLQHSKDGTFLTERGFGFAEPYNIYSSLKELVLHYAQNSLEEHNDSLTTTLAFPVHGDIMSDGYVGLQEAYVMKAQRH
ncbi:hypothetical protein B566_EDAN019056 [Ephemera danica]|nr:hypothetical protein B566_EDAN019056 [Ephemera danica]